MLHGGKGLGCFKRLQHVARTRWPLNQWLQQQQQQRQRGLLTLAIETSCDDTAVAILETTGSLNGHHQHRLSHPASSTVSNYDLHNPIHNDASFETDNQSSHDTQSTQIPQLQSQAVDLSSSQDVRAVSARILFHEKVTARNTGLGGIHPIEALESHQTNLARLVSKAIASLPDADATAIRTEDEVERRRTFQFYRRHLPTEVSSTGHYHRHGEEVQSAPMPTPAPAPAPAVTTKILPDFVTVTRGPGMRSNLACGLDTAKGLAAAWQVPLVGVHHMQAHALTPRLVDALKRDNSFQQQKNEHEHEQEQEQKRRIIREVKDKNYMDIQTRRSSSNSLLCASKVKDQARILQPQLQPQFPFLTLLISGGHTMLVYSSGLIDHRIVATTRDIAVGDALDKCGRVILPEKVKSGMQDTAYAKFLSEWLSTSTQSTELWPVPKRRKFEIDKPKNEFGWQVQTPLADTRDTAFSFTSIATSIEKLFTERNNSAVNPIGDSERLMFARTALGISFEHLGSRTIIALENLRAKGNDISTLVVSGGVAANSFLRIFLRSMLDARGYENVKLLFPPPWLCTDNAVMIAWSGIEMFEAGFQSQPDIRALRKWSMDPTAADGGILGVGGWI